jgi:hypothetical protein
VGLGVGGVCEWVGHTVTLRALLESIGTTDIGFFADGANTARECPWGR